MSTIYFTKNPDRKRFVASLISKFKNSIQGKVLIKVNLVSHNPYPTTTHPEMIESVYAEIKANASEIICGDGQSIDLSAKKIENHPIVKKCQELGVHFVNVYDYPFRKVKTSRGFNLKVSDIPFQQDFIISLPILKDHFIVKLTNALKDKFGYLPKTERLKIHAKLKDIHKGIAELNTIFKSHLIICDALKVMIKAQEFRHGGEEKDLGYLFAGTDRGVYLSTDNGANWTPRNTGQDSLLVISLLVRDSIILAGTFGGGVFRSTDYGESWNPANNGLASDVVWSLVLLDTTILAGTWWSEHEGIFRSFDNGTTWEPIQQPPVWNQDVNALAILDTLIFAGTHGGVFFSSDTGENWGPFIDGPDEIVNCLHVSNKKIIAGTTNGVYINWNHSCKGLIATTINTLARNDSYLFAGTEYNELFRSDDDGVTWSRTHLYSSGIASLLCVGTDLFVGTQNGTVFRSADNGDSWKPVLFIGDGTEKFTAFAFVDSNLFAGNYGNGIFLSTDTGTHWTPVDAGLTETLVHCLAVRGTDIYAGTENGMFYSADYGTSWSSYNLGLTDTNVQCLTVCDGNLFAGTKNGGIFLSTNEGSEWTQVSTGLSNLNIQCLASGNTKVFAVNSDGIFLSENYGSSWYPVDTGLINRPVLAIDIGSTNLFAGIMGAGVWRRPLSEMNTPTGRDQLVQGGILTYPNPASSFVTIQFPNPSNENFRLSIIDPSGKIVQYLNEVNSDRVEINLEYLGRGFYIIQIKGPRIYQGKLIIK